MSGPCSFPSGGLTGEGQLHSGCGPGSGGNGPGPCRGPDFEAQGESIDFGEQKDSDQRPNQEKPN